MKAIDTFSFKLSWDNLDASYLKQLIEIARHEDMQGLGLADDFIQKPDQARDATSDLIAMEAIGKANLVARKDLTVCGLPLIQMILDQYGSNCQCFTHYKEGENIAKGQVLATIQGPAKTLLEAERVVLNFLQHLSGIATNTNLHVSAMGETETRLLDTRKTTPGYRALEKYAVSCGAAWNHRYGLYDRIMLKDNHLAVSGATGGDRLLKAVKNAKEKANGLLVQVEVDTLSQIEPIIEAGADIILLDNFSVAELKQAVAMTQGKVRTEASGGISLDSLKEIAQVGVDFISCGALIHQSQWIDIGLDWEE